MLLIDKSGVRRVCERCHRVRVRIHANAKLCVDCRKTLLNEAIAMYCEDHRSIYLPVECFGMLDSGFFTELRRAMREADGTIRRRRAI